MSINRFLRYKIHSKKIYQMVERLDTATRELQCFG